MVDTVGSGADVNVSEVQAMIPKAEVYALRADARYLIVVDKGKVSLGTLEGFVQFMDEINVPVAILGVAGDPGDAVRLFEDVPAPLVTL